MGRPALAASRAIEVLTFLAARPSQPFTLSEIAERLDLSLASAHGLLAVLTDAGFLDRDPVHKTFELGPALVAVGHAALERHRAIDLARDEVRRLSEELELEAMASAVVGSDLIVLARAGRPGRLEQLPRVGQRIPLAPPIGAAFVAWRSETEVADWFARFGISDASTRAELTTLLGHVREVGYEIALDTPGRRKIERLLRELALAPRMSGAADRLSSLTSELLRERHHPGGLEARRTYHVNYCMAPVFGARAQPRLALSLLGFAAPTKGADLLEVAAVLRDRAVTITMATEGALPPLPLA